MKLECRHNILQVRVCVPTVNTSRFAKKKKKKRMNKFGETKSLKCFASLVRLIKLL